MSLKSVLKGGKSEKLIFEGTPDELAKQNTSTGKFLAKHLAQFMHKINHAARSSGKFKFSQGGEPDLLSVRRSAFWQLWKRRALLLVALLILLVPLYGTFEPLFEFILFAVSLATLTFPIFLSPSIDILENSYPNA